MNRKPIITAGIFLGVGLGGFIDGIIFHQIFQFHSMLSGNLRQDALVNVKTNMVWDGLFHLFTEIFTLYGVVLLWKAGKTRNVLWSGRILSGAVVFGWGLFNLIEGTIDHHILGIHHVIEQKGLSFYDYLFLLSSLILIIIGSMLMRKAPAAEVIQTRFKASNSKI